MDIKTELSNAVLKALQATEGEAAFDVTVEVPPSPDKGDYAVPCFRLSKALRKAPPVIAQMLLETVEKPDFVSEMKIEGGYLNFYLDKGAFVKSVLSDVLVEKENFGRRDIGQNQAVTIDYSSPNIAKPFHIGHLRTTVIGQALYNIYNFLGYNSIGINHLGDWGTQFGKMIVAYKNWGNKQDIEEKGIPELNRLYVRFHTEAETNPSLEDDARAWLVKMQEGDEEALSLWKWFVDISLVEFNRVYKMLNIKFDHYTGESFYNDKMDAVVEELKEKDIMVESEGAMIVDLEPYNMPPCLILRRDGGTLYPTRDIAAAFYRKRTYNFVKSLYVVGFEQSMHFTQWFKVVELMGYDWAKDMVHIPFGLVNLEGGKLSTRKGNVILLEDLLNEAISRTLDIINEKNPNLENKEAVAKQVGVGAIIFNDLYNNRIKDVTFSFQRVLSFDGETGPYVQYTHARAASVLAKAGVTDFSDVDYTQLTDEASFEVAKLLNIFGDKVQEAADKYEPSVVTRFVMQLAQAFNKFYHDNTVLCSDENTKKARLALVFAVKHVLATGLGLLGIGAPDKM